MKRAPYIIAAFVLIGIVVFVMLTGNAEAQIDAAPNKLTFDAPQQSFVMEVAEETYQLQYTFTNTGGDLVEITSVDPKCGCTVSELKKRNYAPGESGVIDVVFSAERRQGTVNKGIVVTYQFADEEPLVRELRLTAEIPVLFKAKRTTLVWRTDDSALSQRIEIEKFAPYKIAFTHAEYDKKLFTVDIDDGEKQAVVTIGKLDSTYDGVSLVKLFTNVPQQRYRQLTIKNLVEKNVGSEEEQRKSREVRLYPDTLVWRGADVTQRKISFRSRLNAIAITSIEVKNGDFDASFALSDSNDYYVITVKPRAAATVLGVPYIRIETTSPLPTQKVINYNLVQAP